MADTPLTKTTITAVFCAMLAFAVGAALLGIFLSGLLGENGTLFRWATFAMSACGIVTAFVMRATFLKHLPPEERKTGTIQRQ